MPREDNVLDLSLHHAHAERSSQLTESTVNFAQMEPDLQLITDNASQCNANQTKSSVMTYNAQLANGANQDPHQTALDNSVFKLQDHLTILVMLNVVLAQYLTMTELNVSTAHKDPNQTLIRPNV